MKRILIVSSLLVAVSAFAADKRFDELPVASTPSGTEVVPVMQGGASKQSTVNQIAPVRSVAGRTGAVVLDKTDVGLGNVNNTADASKSVATAAALTANGTNCGAGQAAAGVDASGNAEGCFSPAGSGDASTNTATSVDSEAVEFSGTTGKLLKRSAKSGIIKETAGVKSVATAGTDYVVPGGNVATANALAANGTNCGAGQAAAGVDASGNAEGCFSPAGSGDTSTNTATSVDSEAVEFSGTTGKLLKRSAKTGIIKETAGVKSVATAGTDYVVPGGNVATANALAANGSNCSAGNHPLGVDASGNAESCTADFNPAAPGAIGGTTPAAGNFTTLSSTGQNTLPKVIQTSANALAALAIDPTFSFCTKSIAADSTFTFSATGTTDAPFTCAIKNTDTNPHIATIPSSYSIARQSTVTTVAIPAGGMVFLTWRYDGSAYQLLGNDQCLSKTGATAAPTGTDDGTKGYCPSVSFWHDTTNAKYYVNATNGTGTATWTLLNSAGGSDTNAVHVNASGEIAGVTAKTTPASADLLLIEDSAASNAKKKSTVAQIVAAGAASGLDTTAIHTGASGEINGVTAKTTPAAADLLLIEDSAASNAKKKSTVAQIVAAGAASGLDTTALHTGTSGEINALTSKATPTTSDFLVIEDAAASNAKKKITIDGALAANDARTKTLQNTSYDCAGTGNVCKQKGYIFLTHPHLCDGTNATIGTTATAIGYGHATFSNSVAATSNYCEYYIQVPEDIDTSVALRARLKDVLGGVDTSVRRYVLSSVSVANSASPTGSTLANAINIDMSADASGASGDVETSAWTTLTSWNGALTAGQTWRIRIARDGSSGTDASTTNSQELGLVIEYGVTQ